MKHRDLLVCLLGGVLTALSVPPFGWWVLGPIGLAILCDRLGGQSWRGRIARGIAFGAGLYGVGLAWAFEFSGPGAVIWMIFTAILTGLFAVLVPPDRGRLLGFPAVIVITEVVRSIWPFNGLPLSGIDLGQSGGPLAPIVAVGGRYLLVGVTAVAAVALVAIVRRPRKPLAAIAAATLVVAVAAAGWWAPDGHRAGRLRVAVVQGGGARGIPALEADAQEVFGAHLAATERVRPPVDLVLWPEDVVDVSRFNGSPEEQELSDLARRLHTTLIAGIVEDSGTTRFKNAAVAFGPDGRRVDRYDKKHRVPFGEYFPFRSLLEKAASIPDRDAVVGRGPGILDTPAGRFGVLISYEVFFQGRARTAVGTDAGVVLVPTNASSFTTGQMPAQELAAARLRAWQSGRDVLQASPTGYSAVIDHRGHVRSHTDLGRREVLHAAVQVRSGSTPYDRTGDWPVVLLAALALLSAWLSTFLVDSRSDRLHTEDATDLEETANAEEVPSDADEMGSVP